MTKDNVRYSFELDSKKIIKVTSDVNILVVNNFKDFKTFSKVPFLVYKDDENWVAPLWQEVKSFFKFKNPFWRHSEARLFIAYKNGVAVGRIVTVIDQLFIKKEKQDIGFFGFFECIDDYNISSALFDVAKDWLKTKGMSVMRGPIDARVDVRCGFLYEGSSESPYIFGSYNPRYYVDFVEKYGMEKTRDQLVYYLDLNPPIPDYLKDAANKCKEMGIKIRGFNRWRTGKEIDWWVKLMMDTFSFHWGYVDVPEEEVRTRFGVKQARWVVDSKLFLVAESPDGKPIAFKWSTPDYNQVFKKLNGNLGILGALKFLYYRNKINRGRLNFVGIDKAWQGKNIGSAMNYYTMLEMKKRGYSGAECGWIDEKNIASQRTIEKTGAKYYKRYRVYDLKI